MRFDCLHADYIGEIVAIERACFADPWSQRQFEQELSNELAHYVVALMNDQVVGYGGVWSISGEGNITNIAVHPDFRKRGIGQAVVERLISYAQELGLEFLTLEVRESNQGAISLYRKNGFEQVGARKGYYADNGETALLMTKYL